MCNYQSIRMCKYQIQIKLIMFEEEFIEAAGLDYRNQYPSKFPSYDEMEAGGQPNVVYDQGVASLIQSLRSQVDQQTILINQYQYLVRTLKGEITNTLQYTFELEKDLECWKNRAIQLEDVLQGRELDIMPPIAEEDSDQQELSKMSRDPNRFDSPIETQYMRSPSNPSPGSNQIAGSPIYSNLLTSNQKNRFPKGSQTKRFKSLIKIVVESMVTVISVLGEAKNKQTGDTMDILRKKLTEFSREFNQKYSNFKGTGFTDHQEARMVRILKEYGSEVNYIYQTMSKGKELLRSTAKKRRDLESTAKK